LNIPTPQDIQYMLEARHQALKDGSKNRVNRLTDGVTQNMKLGRLEYMFCMGDYYEPEFDEEDLKGRFAKSGWDIQYWSEMGFETFVLKQLPSVEH